MSNALRKRLTTILQMADTPMTAKGQLIDTNKQLIDLLAIIEDERREARLDQHNKNRRGFDAHCNRCIENYRWQEEEFGRLRAKENI